MAPGRAGSGYNVGCIDAISVPTMTSHRLCLWSAARLAGLSACLWLGASGAWAERADRLQPMQIEADALRYDDSRQTSVFTGNVVVSKGSIVIRGQEIEVRQDPQGHQFSTVRGLASRPAFFRQKREGLDEFIEGEAERIEYDSQANTVVFQGQAVLRRFRGATLNDETRGSRIVYNGNRETFSVDGGQGARNGDNPSGRVRALLTPSAAPTPPAAPAAPQPLTPSTRLEPRQ
jgi:lipopolysaccharide export system protein LptA